MFLGSFIGGIRFVASWSVREEDPTVDLRLSD